MPAKIRNFEALLPPTHGRRLFYYMRALSIPLFSEQFPGSLPLNTLHTSKTFHPPLGGRFQVHFERTRLFASEGASPHQRNMRPTPARQTTMQVHPVLDHQHPTLVWQEKFRLPFACNRWGQAGGGHPLLQASLGPVPVSYKKLSKASTYT